MADDTKFEREHPSYGMLHISRCTSTGPLRLFGSPLATHYGSIRLTISAGKWLHDLHHDRYYGMSEDFIDIEMSAAQFADAITSLNMGSGTPCTIRYVNGKQIENPPKHATEAEHIHDNFESSLEDFAAKAETYRKEIEGLVAKLPEKARNRIRIALDGITHQLTSNVPFVVKQFQEATTRITTSAKAEVDAFVTNMVRAAGIQAITDGRLPSLLPSGDDAARAMKREIVRAGVCPACLSLEDCLAQCPLAGDPRCERNHFQNCQALLTHHDSECDCAIVTIAP